MTPQQSFRHGSQRVEAAVFAPATRASVRRPREIIEMPLIDDDPRPNCPRPQIKLSRGVDVARRPLAQGPPPWARRSAPRREPGRSDDGRG